jgi:hypothetical protein
LWNHKFIFPYKIVEVCSREHSVISIL